MRFLTRLKGRVSYSDFLSTVTVLLTILGFFR